MESQSGKMPAAEEPPRMDPLLWNVLEEAAARYHNRSRSASAVERPDGSSSPSLVSPRTPLVPDSPKKRLSNVPRTQAPRSRLNSSDMPVQHDHDHDHSVCMWNFLEETASKWYSHASRSRASSLAGSAPASRAGSIPGSPMRTENFGRFSRNSSVASDLGVDWGSGEEVKDAAAMWQLLENAAISYYERNMSRCASTAPDDDADPQAPAPPPGLLNALPPHVRVLELARERAQSPLLARQWVDRPGSRASSRAGSVVSVDMDFGGGAELDKVLEVCSTLQDTALQWYLEQHPSARPSPAPWASDPSADTEASADGVAVAEHAAALYAMLDEAARVYYRDAHTPSPALPIFGVPPIMYSAPNSAESGHGEGVTAGADSVGHTADKVSALHIQ